MMKKVKPVVMPEHASLPFAGRGGGLCGGTDVGQKYDIYERLLLKWNDRMNLVAKSTLSDIRTRHILDSAQMAGHIPRGKTVIDLGSGAGFPAVVLAILGYGVVAIESVGKKCRFLETVRRELNLQNLTIVNDRAEKALPKIFSDAAAAKNSVFTARAFAPLMRILDLTRKLDTPHVLLKGRNARDEIALAREKYDFDADLYPSATGDGFIVKLTTK